MPATAWSMTNASPWATSLPAAISRAARRISLSVTCIARSRAGAAGRAICAAAAAITRSIAVAASPATISAAGSPSASRAMPRFRRRLRNISPPPSGTIRQRRARPPARSRHERQSTQAAETVSPQPDGAGRDGRARQPGHRPAGKRRGELLAGPRIRPAQSREGVLSRACLRIPRRARHHPARDRPKSPAAKHYKKSDIAKGVYLAFAQGNVIERPKSPKPVQRVFSFAPPAAMENWRVVHDFEPGPVAVALCNAKIYNLVLANEYSIDDMTAPFSTRKNRREGDFVVLFGHLARYLTEDGVIDPALVPAGHLTRSMCSPWQYDFTDCGCFFWASNKPDMVASADQPLQILNFQRKNRAADAARQPTDWLLKDQAFWDGVNMLGHVDLIQHFDKLKFVIAGQETDDYVPVTTM